jgi:photosystem II stability/assembly factor-like uncharacterized protein
MAEILKTGSARIWVIPYGAGPTHVPQFQQYGALGSIDWDQGDVTNIEAPSAEQYSNWVVVDSFQGSAGRATSTLTVYETTASSLVMDLIRQRCKFDLQVHKGLCEDPRTFKAFQKIRVMQGAVPASLSTSDNGTLTGDGEGAAQEELSVSADVVFDIYPMTYAEVAATYVGEQIKGVAICDSLTCGGCGGAVPSDGCQKVFAVTDSAASSPGLQPQVIATADGGTVWVERNVTSATIGQTVNDLVCMGDYLLVVSNAGGGYHYATISEILTEAETWAAITTGFNGSGPPNAAWNANALLTFFAGDGGYVYQSVDSGVGVTTLSAATATSENLDDIAGWDTEHVSAVGENAAFIYTTDGTTFVLGTGPSGPTDLLAVAYREETEIWVCGDNGLLYYTVNFGTSWGSKSLASSVATVNNLIWVNETVGYAFCTTSGSKGAVYRTVDGGYSWFVVPENVSLAIPAADSFGPAAICNDPNTVWFGGLADNAADGILVKGSV